MAEQSDLGVSGTIRGIGKEPAGAEAATAAPASPRPSVDRKAEAAYQDARERFASGHLAACLVRVSEALRLCPEHGGAGELGEKLRQAVVERAAWFENETEADLDVLVAAYLACTPPLHSVRAEYDAVTSYLDCGLFESGFARVYCPECRVEFLVAFSCKGRGLCFRRQSPHCRRRTG